MHSNWHKTLIERVFKISTPEEFEQTALEIFAYQKVNNKVYKRYIELLGKDTAAVSQIRDIPCLPVSIFKTHKVLSSPESGKIIFRSSGTGGSAASEHYVEPGFYEDCFLKCFESFTVTLKIIAYLHCFLHILKEEILRWFIWRSGSLS
jgi:hypothetical protein